METTVYGDHKGIASEYTNSLKRIDPLVMDFKNDQTAERRKKQSFSTSFIFCVCLLRLCAWWLTIRF